MGKGKYIRLYRQDYGKKKTEIKGKMIRKSDTKRTSKTTSAGLG